MSEPAYDAGGLATVLPSVARALGIPPFTQGPAAERGLLELPQARRAVVVLVDGLGHDLLIQRGGHAPFLRTLLPTGRRLVCGFPSTTATSMGTFGTGLPPGTHGLVGFQVRVPGEDRLLNELSWEKGPDPFAWQPSQTVFERAEAAGVDVTRIGPAYFDGSGLTNAALRGGSFAAAAGLEQRVDLTLEVLRRSPRALVYLYWGDLDKVGHVHGCRSWQWGDELEAIDAALARLARSLPADTALLVTADHGMVDVPHEQRIDLADDAELSAGIRLVGGEPRGLQLYCEPGAAEDVRRTWQGRVGDRAQVRTREEAVALGWFGAVADRVVPRIGDLVIAMGDGFAVVDSRFMRPQIIRLLGVHGSLSDDELGIPLLHQPARAVA
ncbi:MAG TPA: nucleotide pyrophosphatase/phosphodiesterase family protein [Segeticoccus sp.]|uniref:alkaline phosphatase family protein n=1 Tax=Segeticoccus sp. TaxID=2706531 RepID=UPI002D8069C2|nr:alkaline phosphatase family protein [Segeticoccus sp.]HET8598902.1 nucleotide pyrophosphatase/phosphodiesterase family protein [Segeticoccus sp.]